MLGRLWNFLLMCTGITPANDRSKPDKWAKIRAEREQWERDQAAREDAEAERAENAEAR